MNSYSRGILVALIQCSTLLSLSSSTILRPLLYNSNNRHFAVPPPVAIGNIRGGSLSSKSSSLSSSINKGSSSSSSKFTPSSTSPSTPQLSKDKSLIENRETIKAIQKYKLQQQHLLQLRSTFLSEALAARGINVGPSMVDVSTPEGSKPPKEVDWDCCMSTEDDPKTCLYSFDAEPNTKVICPAGTTQYISLSALNRLRRTDPSKVEPMWHDQYAILKSWFNDESEYSLLQFVGLKGFIVSTVLLDLGKGLAFRMALAMGVLAVTMLFLPLVEVVMSRVLTSSFLWMKWQSWGKFVHAALPLKILIGQMVWKFVAGSFAKLEAVVKDYVVDLECAILEESIPVTVGGVFEIANNVDEDFDNRTFAEKLNESVDENSESEYTDGSSNEYDY